METERELEAYGDGYTSGYGDGLRDAATSYSELSDKELMAAVYDALVHWGLFDELQETHLADEPIAILHVALSEIEKRIK